MSLYNMMNGFNPACVFIMPMLGRKYLTTRFVTDANGGVVVIMYSLMVNASYMFVGRREPSTSSKISGRFWAFSLDIPAAPVVPPNTRASP